MEKKALIKSRALKDVLAMDSVKSRLSEILGARAPQFAAALVQIQQRSWQLQKCDGVSIVGAAITAAALDLSVDPQLGEAHLVPYRDKCTFQLGYIGLSQLAQRSGQYKRLGWVVVHQGELVSYDELAGELEINTALKSGEKVIGYAAKFVLINGFERAEFWTVERCTQHAERYSQAYRAGLKDQTKRESPWWTDFDRMALKTVLKSLLRTWGPKSVQMRQAVVADEAAIDVSGEVEAYPDNGQETGEITKPEFEAPPTTAPTEKVVSGKAVTVTPTPPVTENYNHAKVIRGLIEARGVTEEKLIAFLHEMGMVDDGIGNLDDVPAETLQMAIDQLDDICERIGSVKRGSKTADDEGTLPL